MAKIFVGTLDSGFVIAAGTPPGGCCVAISIASGSATDALFASLGVFRMEISKTHRLAPLVTLLIEEVQQPRCGTKTVLFGYAEALIVHLLRGATEAGVAEVGLMAGLSDPRLAKALVAMHEAPQSNWSVSDLAEKAGMSRSSFIQSFSAKVGATPMAYLRNWRIARAGEALANGARVSEVARRFGYTSQDAFSRAFHKATGQLPSQFSQQVTRPV